MEDTKFYDPMMSKLNDSGFQSFSSEEELLNVREKAKNKKLDDIVLGSNDYLNRLGPNYEMSDKVYSLEPDMITGWRPKLSLISPVPLKFDSTYLDYLIKELTKDKFSKFKVVYLGFRPYDSFDLHESFSGRLSYGFKYMYLKHSKAYELLLKDRKKNDKSLYNLDLNEGKANGRPFIGMSPDTLPSSLVFDSYFESGNLDCAIKVTENEYDLFMRVDSNTKGHLQWFYFCVKNTKKNTKVRFNISNFTKSNSLYLRGMKPYVFSKTLNELKGNDWSQEGQNIYYASRRLQYDHIISFLQVSKRYYCLSFDYEFLYDNDEVYFAYCVPYSYSKLVKFLAEESVKQKKNIVSDTKMKQVKLGSSLSGLDIPLLVITDFENNEVAIHNRKSILISARIHPGETNGSWMMHGLLQFLLGDSTEAQYLRSRVVFKIVPMLNPDGVVLGNYRSSLAGRDLNRQFKEGEQNMFPCVKLLKELARDMKKENYRGFFCFIDLHGHSAKRNVFAYGPEYEKNSGVMFLKSRVIPKMLAKKTDMFRYPSCRFQIPSYKKYTGRAHMFLTQNVPFCYTIEASFGSFSRADRTKVNFNCSHFCEMGKKIGEVLHDYLYKIERLELFKKQKQMNKALRGARYRNVSYYDTNDDSETSEVEMNNTVENNDEGKDGRCKSLETIEESVRKKNNGSKKEGMEKDKGKNLSKRKTAKPRKRKNSTLQSDTKIKSANPKSSRFLYEKTTDSDSDFETFFKDVLGDLDLNEVDKMKTAKQDQDSDDAISEGRSDSESSDEDIGEEDFNQFKEELQKKAKTFTNLIKHPDPVSHMKNLSKIENETRMSKTAEKVKSSKKRNNSGILSKDKVKLPQLTSSIKVCVLSKDEAVVNDRKISSTQEKKRNSRKDSNADNMSLEFTNNPMQSQINQIHKLSSKSTPLTLNGEKYANSSKSKKIEENNALKKGKQPYGELTTINLHYLTKTNGDPNRNNSIGNSNAVHRILKNIDNKNSSGEPALEERRDIKPIEFFFEINFPSQNAQKGEESEDTSGNLKYKNNVPAAFYSIQRHHQRIVERRKGEDFGGQSINKSRQRVLSGTQRLND